MLKVIAVIFIVISHAMPDEIGGTLPAIDINCTTMNLQYFVIALLHNLGQIGNDIFVLTSTWFLLDSTNVKQKKIIGMVSSCFVISVIFLIIGFGLGYEFSFTYIIRNLLPITFSANWFVTCYLLLYLIHPYLNMIVANITQQQLLRINLCFGVLYFGLGFLTKNNLFYFSNIIGFVAIYFLATYVKLYLKKLSENPKVLVCGLFVGVLGWLCMMLCTNFLGLRLDFFSNRLMHWNTFMNPFFILIAFSMFHLFRKVELQSRVINYISGLSLLIYIIHCNRVIRDYVRYDIFEYIYMRYSYDYILLWVMLYALISLVLALGLAVLYREIVENHISRIGERGYDVVRILLEKIEKYIEKLGY